MKALTPGDWYTNYMVTVAVFLFCLTLGVSLVAKEVLGLPLRGAVFCGYGFLGCNTLFWLASAHYSPNVAGLALQLQEGFNSVRVSSEMPPEVPPSAGTLELRELVPVDPFVSPTSDQWNRRWNLATPPDEKGFPSHLCFTRINLILD
jgi:hypothetical protein